MMRAKAGLSTWERPDRIPGAFVGCFRSHDGHVVESVLDVGAGFQVDERKGVDPDLEAEPVQPGDGGLIDGEGLGAGGGDDTLASLDFQSQGGSPLASDSENGMGIHDGECGQGQGFDPQRFHDSSGELGIADADRINKTEAICNAFPYRLHVKRR